jgi:hypothetical protein
MGRLVTYKMIKGPPSPKEDLAGGVVFFVGAPPVFVLDLRPF